ncbi:type II toxin-antitoxin system death-on-curing family toxin [Helicobacter gastrofelis]|uniref:type II toxin-antitoxin system death-on-curing family toxin n=1 Tax=Helicobacter gastrofelis TaxID=2849642 RepID=UPI001C843E06|nr:type II toxin-antitoxin system death-on-curing family toxin [Helicobacter sp. NHP19-012]
MFFFCFFETVIEIHDEILGLTEGLKDYNLTSMGYLESVLNYIRNDRHCPTFESKLAYLVFSCVKFHPFFDENKRTAVYLAIHFLKLNDKPINNDCEKFFEPLVLDIATDKIGKE